MKKVFILQSTINNLFVVFSSRDAAQKEMDEPESVLNLDGVTCEEFRKSLVIYQKYVF